MAHRILIVRPDKLGDLVQTLPMATAIKQHMPEAEIHFIVSSYTAPLLALAPDVDGHSIIDTSSDLATLKRFFKTAANAADEVSIFFPSARGLTARLAYAARLGAKISGRKLRLVGTGYRWYSPLFTHRIYEHRRDATFHEAEYNVRMLRAIGIESAAPPTKLHVPASTVNHVKRELSTLLSSDTYAVIHANTGGSTLAWRMERFERVGEWVARSLALPVVLTGIETDREVLFTLKRSIEDAGGKAELFVGNSLVELAAALQGAELVFANSTGPGHLAAALGARTVGMFPLIKPLSKERWGFRGARVRNLTPVTSPKATCPTCKECVCMDRIQISDVTQAAEELLLTVRH